MEANTQPLDISDLGVDTPEEEAGPYDQYTDEEKDSLYTEEADRQRPLREEEIAANLDRLHNPPTTDSRIATINQNGSWNERVEAKLDILIELAHGVPALTVPAHKQEGVRADQPPVHPPENVNLPPVTQVSLDDEHPTGGSR